MWNEKKIEYVKSEKKIMLYRYTMIHCDNVDDTRNNTYLLIIGYWGESSVI